MNSRPLEENLPLSPISIRGVMRFDPYGHPHKGLRHRLQVTLTDIGTIDVVDCAATSSVLHGFTELLDDLGEHVALENVHLHPLLETAQPGSAARTVADHICHEQSIDALTRAAQEVASRINLGFLVEAQAMARRLYLHTSCFIAEVFEHFHHEETEQLRLLWLTYPDEVLESVFHEMIRASTQTYLERTSAWLFPALSRTESTSAARAMHRALDPENLEPLRGVIDRYLDNPVTVHHE